MCHHLICSERKHQLWTFVSDRKVNQLAEVLAEHVYAQNVLLQSLCFVHTSIATVKSSTQREKWILSSQLQIVAPLGLLYTFLLTIHLSWD